MSSQKRLRPVCHNIAHHAASGLSFLHPHFAQACRGAGASFADLDLLQDRPFPLKLKPLKTLEYACAALQKRAENILAAEKFALKDLSVLLLRFDFSKTKDDYQCDCHVLIISAQGDEFRESVNSIGDEVERDYSLGKK